MNHNYAVHQTPANKLACENNRALQAGLFTMIFLSLCSTALAQGTSKLGRPVRDLSQLTKPEPGRYNLTIKVGSETRTFILVIPTGYAPAPFSKRIGTPPPQKPFPLVVGLHGKGGQGGDFEKESGLTEKAQADNFIVVYPNALGDPSSWDPQSSDTKDVVFITALIDALENTLKIDNKRIYVCGFSAGGFMAYRMGVELASRIAAIGVGSGAIGNANYTVSRPRTPVPAIVFHGKMDPNIGYNGGVSPHTNLSVAESIKFWTKADGCTNQPHQTKKQNGNLVIDDYDQCRDGSEVVLYSFGTGTHEWPRLSNNDKYDATQAELEFFWRHPKP